MEELASRARRRDRALAAAQERGATRSEEGGAHGGTMWFPRARTLGSPAPLPAAVDRDRQVEQDVVAVRQLVLQAFDQLGCARLRREQP